MWVELLVEVEAEAGRGCVRLGRGVVVVFGLGLFGWGGLTAEAILGVRGARLMPLTAVALSEGIGGRALAVVEAVAVVAAGVVWVSWPMVLFCFTVGAGTRATLWSRSLIRGVRWVAARGRGSGRGRRRRCRRGLVVCFADGVAAAAAVAAAVLAGSRDGDGGGGGDVSYVEGFVACGGEYGGVSWAGRGGCGAGAARRGVSGTRTASRGVSGTRTASRGVSGGSGLVVPRLVPLPVPLLVRLLVLPLLLLPLLLL